MRGLRIPVAEVVAPRTTASSICLRYLHPFSRKVTKRNYMVCSKVNTFHKGTISDRLRQRSWLAETLPRSAHTKALLRI
jgi:hypothetical protein